MESYTYLFLFVLQLVFTVVVLLALLHENGYRSNWRRKQTTTDGVIELARRDSSHEEHVLDVYREDSTHIRIDYDSLGRIKEIDFSNRKLKKNWKESKQFSGS